jgi:magnesium transporter
LGFPSRRCGEFWRTRGSIRTSRTHPGKQQKIVFSQSRASEILPRQTHERTTRAVCPSIDIPTREELAEIEVSSRLYQEDHATFMTATIVHRGSDDRAETSAVTFILKDRLLITVRYAEPRAFPLFVRQLQRPGHCPITGEAALIGLLEAIIDRAADHLEVTRAILDQTSRSVFNRAQDAKPAANTKRYQELVTSIGEQGDFVSKMRESFVTLGRMVAYLSAASAATRSTGAGISRP